MIADNDRDKKLHIRSRLCQSWINTSIRASGKMHGIRKADFCIEFPLFSATRRRLM